MQYDQMSDEDRRMVGGVSPEAWRARQIQRVHDHTLSRVLEAGFVLSDEHDPFVFYEGSSEAFEKLKKILRDSSKIYKETEREGQTHIETDATQVIVVTVLPFGARRLWLQGWA
jgi:hypothetical protein